MFRALFLSLFLAACSRVSTEAYLREQELVLVADAKDACSESTMLPDGSISCSMFVVFDDGVVLRLAEVRNGTPYVEEQYLVDRPVRFGTWLSRHVRDPSGVILYCVGPYESGYDRLWYEFLEE